MEAFRCLQAFRATPVVDISAHHRPPLAVLVALVRGRQVLVLDGVEKGTTGLAGNARGVDEVLVDWYAKEAVGYGVSQVV